MATTTTLARRRTAAHGAGLEQAAGVQGTGPLQPAQAQVLVRVPLAVDVDLGAGHGVVHVDEAVEALASKPVEMKCPPGGHFPDRGGEDLVGRALPYLGAGVGNPGTLETLETELRYLAQRLDNNLTEDADRNVRRLPRRAPGRQPRAR